MIILLRHGPDLHASFLGAMLAGHIPSFMPTLSPRQDPTIYWTSHQSLFSRIRPAAVVASAEDFAVMDAAGLDLHGAVRIEPSDADSEPEPASDIPLDADLRTGADTALLQHSSGTTGLKKGVRLSYDAIRRQLRRYGRAIGIDSSDVVVSWLPLYHDMGLMACFLLPLHVGASVVQLDPFDWVARPTKLFVEVEKRGGTLLWLPNFAFEHLIRMTADPKQHSLASVRAVINCSEPCRPDTMRRFAAHFREAGLRPAALQCCYAMAETVFAVAQTPLETSLRIIRIDPRHVAVGDRVRSAEALSGEGIEVIAMGEVLPGLEVSIRGPDRVPLPPGHVGEVAVRGDFLFDGYNADPARTSAQVAGGWYYTNDVGFVGEGGLHLLGRTDDFLIVNGINLVGQDVEALVARIDGIRPGRAVAFSVPDSSNASDVLVIVAEKADPDVDAKSLKAAVSRHVFSSIGVRPVDVRIVDAGWLVKTTSGKIGRSANRDKYRLSLQTRDP